MIMTGDRDKMEKLVETIARILSDDEHHVEVLKVTQKAKEEPEVCVEATAKAVASALRDIIEDFPEDTFKATLKSLEVLNNAATRENCSELHGYLAKYIDEKVPNQLIEFHELASSVLLKHLHSISVIQEHLDTLKEKCEQYEEHKEQKKVDEAEEEAEREAERMLDDAVAETVKEMIEEKSE